MLRTKDQKSVSSKLRQELDLVILDRDRLSQELEEAKNAHAEEVASLESDVDARDAVIQHLREKLAESEEKRKKSEENLRAARDRAKVEETRSKELADFHNARVTR